MCKIDPSCFSGDISQHRNRRIVTQCRILKILNYRAVHTSRRSRIKSLNYERSIRCQRIVNRSHKNSRVRRIACRNSIFFGTVCRQRKNTPFSFRRSKKLRVAKLPDIKENISSSEARHCRSVRPEAAFKSVSTGNRPSAKRNDVENCILIFCERRNRTVCCVNIVNSGSCHHSIGKR